MFNTKIFNACVAILFSFVLFSCGKGEKGCDSENGRAAILEEVDRSLNTNNCAGAIEAVSPYYDLAGCGTNPIRLARAAAYACNAGLNFFNFVSTLSSANLSGTTGFFNTMTQEFPSTLTDSKVVSGNYALDALFATQLPGAVSSVSQLIYSSTVNPGTLVPANRTQDANIYGLLVSMSLLGALQNRYGVPNAATHAITRKLGSNGVDNGWQDASKMTSDGCTYAGALLTFIDSTTQVASVLASSFGSGTATSLLTIASALPLDTACSLGCSGLTGSGCSTSCSKCPDALRGRVACVASSTTDTVSCAAAGIIKTVNALYGL